MSEEVAVVGIKLETDGIDKGIKALDTLAGQGVKVEAALGKVAQASANTGKSLANLGGGSSQSLDALGKSGAAAADGMGKLSTAGKQAEAALGGQATAAKNAATSFATMQAAVAGFTQAESTYIQKLMDEAKQIGMTRGERESYIAQSKGMSDGAQQAAAAIGKRIDALKSEAAAVEDSAKAWKVAGAVIGGVAVAIGTVSFKKFIDESISAERQQTQLAAVLRSTGEAAGFSQKRLNDMAGALGNSSIFSVGEINEAQTRLLSYTGIVGEQFPRAMQNVIDMSARMGMDVKSSAETIGRALDIPSQGLTALTRQGFRFSEAQKELVKELEATGRVGEAQAIVLSALESSYGGAAAAAKDTFGGALVTLKNNINDLMTGDSGSLTGMKKGIDDLNAALSDEKTRAAAQSFIGLISSIASAAISGTAALAGFAGAATADLRKIAGQGELRQAAAEVLNLSNRQAILKRGFEGGSGGSIFKAELDSVSARLEVAKQKFNEVNAAASKTLGAPDARANFPSQGSRVAYEAQSAALQEAQKKASGEWMVKYATNAEKLASELSKARKEMGDSFSPEIEGRIRAQFESRDKGAKSAIASAKQEQSAYDKLIASIKSKIEQNDEEVRSGGKLNDAAKMRIDLAAKLEQGTRKSTDAHRANTAAILEQFDASERALAVFKAQKKFEGERDKEAQAIANEIIAINGKAQALEDEAAAYGKTATELQALTIARLEDKKATLSGFDKEAATAELASINDRIAGLMRLGAASDALASKKLEATAGGWVKMAGEQAKVYQGEAKMAGLSATERAKIVALRKVEIDYVKRIADIDKSIAPDASKESARIEASKAKQIEAATAVSQAIEAEWGKTIDQYDDLFRTGFQQMSLNGEDGIKAFGKTLEAQVYTSIADAIYQALTRKFIVNIIGNVAGGVGGIADAVGLGGGSGGSLLGMASNANSIYGAAGIGSQLMAGGYSAGQMIPAAYAYATGGVLPTAAGLAPLTATAVGSSTVAPVIAGGLVEAGGTAIGTTGAVVGAETAATGALGAMGPYGWIALAAIAAYAAFSGKGDSRFGSQAAYTPGEGAVSYGGPNGKGDDFGGVSAANKASALGIDSLLEKLGSADRIFRFSSGFESSENGKGFSYAGGLLDSGKGFGQGNDGMGYMNNRGSMNAEEAAASYANELKQATLQALQAASDIPKSITDKLAGLNIDGLDTKALDELVATIDKIIVEVDAFQGAIGNLPFKNLRDLSFDAASGLIAAAGGLEQLSAGVTGYMDNFATDGERRALKIQQITAALNAAGAGLTEAQVMGASRKDFRDFAGSVDVTTDEGARLYATLLSVQEGFASLTPELISVAGVTAGLPQIIIDGMLSGDAEGAGALFADTLIFSVQNALFSGFADQITSIITDQLVSPMVTALATGASISEAISGAAIESMVAQANAAAKALNAILTDPTFQSAMSQISAAVSGAVSGSIRTAGAGYTPMQAPSRGGSSYAGGGGGSGGGASAADSIKSAWQSITDSIWGEVKRIRGLLEGAGQEGYAAAQARFAIANAQAQAGDQDAYKSLPELSRAMLDLAENNTSTLIELQRIRAQTAASLTATATGVSAAQGLKLPSFAVGTDYVPRDMLAMIHEGERITPRAFNPAIGGAGNDADVVTELRAQNKLLTELLIASKATEKNTGKTASTLVMVTHDGEAMQTEAI